MLKHICDEVTNFAERGEGLNASFDKKTVQRIQEIQNLDPNTQTVLFNIIDTYLRDAKARVAYGS